MGAWVGSQKLDTMRRGRSHFCWLTVTVTGRTSGYTQYTSSIVSVTADGLAVYHLNLGDAILDAIPGLIDFFTEQITYLSLKFSVCNGHGMRDERKPPPPTGGVGGGRGGWGGAWVSLSGWVRWLVLRQPQNDPPRPPPAPSG